MNTKSVNVLDATPVKSQDSSSQELTAVVNAVRSTAAPPAPSNLNKTGQFALGECTFILNVFTPEKSMGADNVNLLPPQGCPTFFIILKTVVLVLIPDTFGFDNTEVVPPSKSTIVYVTPGVSKDIGNVICAIKLLKPSNAASARPSFVIFFIDV